MYPGYAGDTGGEARPRWRIMTVSSTRGTPPLFGAYLRVARLALHLARGAWIVLTRFPRLDRGARAAQVTHWAGALLRILRVDVSVRGEPPRQWVNGILIASNHVSWLDIYLLHSLLPARFVSKAEVRGWPLIGWLAEAAGTVFLVRERKADAMRVNQVMAEHLRQGDCLALFPEGTTSDGSDLLPFYPSLFQPAVDAGAQVWPVYIRYLDADGQPCADAAYYDDISLGSSLMKIARHGGICGEVCFLPPIDAAGLSRRALAQAAEAAIRARLDAPDNEPGSTVRPPV